MMARTSLVCLCLLLIVVPVHPRTTMRTSSIDGSIAVDDRASDKGGKVHGDEANGDKVFDNGDKDMDKREKSINNGVKADRERAVEIGDSVIDKRDNGPKHLNGQNDLYTDTPAGPWMLRPPSRNISDQLDINEANRIIKQLVKDELGKIGNNSQLFVNVGVREDYLIQDCGHGNNLKMTFPDVDYAFLGYDILKGYPMALGSDPGFTYPIFTADYSGANHTGDCRYSVPRGLVVLPDVSCDISFSSTVLRSSRAFQSQLAVSAQVSGGGWGVQFSASAGYQKAKSVMTDGGYSYVISDAKCSYYISKLQDIKHPKFDESFIEWVRKLDSSDYGHEYYDFFKRYGTHYPTEMIFGAKFMMQHKIETFQLNKMESEGVNVAVSASYSGMLSVGAGFSLDSSQRQQATEFRQKVETNVITVGASPPSNGDALTWASTVQQNPVPMSYKLEDISNLFSEQYMKDLNVDYNKIKSNLGLKREKYWKMAQHELMLDDIYYLLPQSVVISDWYVNGEVQVFSITYIDCLKICKALVSWCHGVSFCESCHAADDSKCFIFGINGENTVNWVFKPDGQWKTIITEGKVTLNDIKVVETLGDSLDMFVRRITSQSDDSQNVIRQCERMFEDYRVSKFREKAVAYSYAYVSGDILVCRIHAFKRILELRPVLQYITVIEV